MLLCAFVASLGLCFSIMAQETASKGAPAPADSALKALPLDSAAQAANAAAVSLMKKRCAGCHKAKSPKAGLNLEPGTLVAMVKDAPSRQVNTLKLVDARSPEKSYLLMKIRGDKGIKGTRMPLDAAPLTAKEIEQIESWIRFISRPAAAPETVPAAGDSARKQ
jgi:uncharacterized membrane protein